MRRDYFVSFVLWMAALAGAVMLMAISGLLMDSDHHLLWFRCFAVSLPLMLILLVVAVTAALGDQEEIKNLKHEKKMTPLIGMTISAVCFVGFAIFYFLPPTTRTTIVPRAKALSMSRSAPAALVVPPKSQPETVGIKIDGGSDITITDNHFSGLTTGIEAKNVKNLNTSRNTFETQKPSN